MALAVGFTTEYNTPVNTVSTVSAPVKANPIDASIYSKELRMAQTLLRKYHPKSKTNNAFVSVVIPTHKPNMKYFLPFSCVFQNRIYLRTYT